MTSRKQPNRDKLLERVSAAGRELSDAAVLFHTTVGARVGLSASQWKVLGILEAHGPLLAGEVAERAGLKPPSVTNILHRLEERRLIRRVGDAEDRRRTWVEVDPVGVSGLYAMFSGLVERLDELYEEYSDDELAVIAEFMSKAAARQRAATAEL